MAKFNTKERAQIQPDTVNKTGFQSYSRDSFKGEVASVVLNSMLNGDSFYETEADRLENIERMITDNPEHSKFMAQAMVYTRNEGNLRSVSHYMAAILAENVKGTSFLKNAFIKTFTRVDDMTETVSLWNHRNPEKMIPNSLRRAVKDRLENRFDSYSLKKYFGTGAVKVSNLIMISHPKPKDEAQRIMFKQALEGTLPNIDTVQTVNASSTGEERAQNYAKMLKERKLGYMGALKNIKNILEAGADDETIDMLCNLLENENACLKSKVLPFRFTQAYSMIDELNIDKFKAKRVLKSIERGFIISARNIPIVEEGESIAILLDESGSMGGFYDEGLTSKSPFMIGKTLMASMLTGLDKDKVLGYLWANESREISVDGSPMEFIKRTRTQGGGTNLSSAISDLIKSKTKVDVLYIMSDMQQNSVGNYSGDRRTFNEMVNDYRKISPKVKIIFHNLQGYGTGTPMKLNNNVLEISGFSEKQLMLIPKMLKDKDALIKEISAIQL